MKRPLLTWVSWSSGKDSAWALLRLQKDPTVAVRGLFTTIHEGNRRASLHGTPPALLERQAAAARLPLRLIPLPDPCPLETYAEIMGRFVRGCVLEGIEAMAFGDLHLADVRRFREQGLAGTGITPLFPLWGTPAPDLAREMLAAGLEARVVCVDTRRLPASLAGRRWDRKFLSRLPTGCDPCGENGEFHTVVTAGPMFTRPIPVRPGKIIRRKGFAWAEIKLARSRRGCPGRSEAGPKRENRPARPS
ncbi:MAG: hypothetical protein WHT06_06550 [Desulfobacterales bacterium]